MTTVAQAAVVSTSPHDLTVTTELTLTPVSEPRVQLVSGHEILLRVTIPTGDTANQVTVSRDGANVTGAFVRQSDGTLLGLVTGLATGANTVIASVPATATNTGQTSTLHITDHPASGPIFSGPQQTPYYCETTAYGLAASAQPTCSAPTQVSYEYLSTATNSFKALADPASRPADLKSALVNGHSVPYVVRLEQGTIDRAVYQIAALYDGNNPSPTTQDAAWNQRLVYTFGGGCNGGHHQGNTTGGVLNDLFLSQGYAVASSSLNVLDNNCNSVISGEAAQMVKEHFIDTYGPVVHTIGWGGSGGSIQQYDIADQYPGILDGIVPSLSFPDPIATIEPVTDCKLLENYVSKNPNALTAAQSQAVSGFRDFATCEAWLVTIASRTTATGSCVSIIPATVAGDPSTRYDATTNPDGVKCNLFEQFANEFGRKADGFANSTFDNTGQQYGLAALQAGTISADQFATLNASVGGIDDAGTLVSQRSVADAPALPAAYTDDLLVNGSQGLRTTPIIDQRDDYDLAGVPYAIHTSDWSFVMRARLLQANGTAGNQVIIDNSPDPTTAANASAYELSAMNHWLDNITADTSTNTQQAKVLADKPGDLGDGCYTTAVNRVLEPLSDPTVAGSTCGTMFPVASNTRTAAGQPLDLKTLKCELAPASFTTDAKGSTSYDGVTVTPAQQQAITAAFPNGVCDYTQPGVDQRSPTSPWLSYGDSATGNPTAPTPVVPVTAENNVTAPVIGTPPRTPPVAMLTLTVPEHVTYGAVVTLTGTAERSDLPLTTTSVAVSDSYADGRTVALGTVVTNAAGTWTLHTRLARNGIITASASGSSVSVASQVAVSYRKVSVTVTTARTVVVRAQIRPGEVVSRNRVELAQLLLVNTHGRTLRVLATNAAAQRVSVPGESYGVNVATFNLGKQRPGNYHFEVKVLGTPLNAGAKSQQVTARVR